MNFSIVRRKMLSLKQVTRGKARLSYSQYGEDLLMMSAIHLQKIENPTYLDIGANDPVKGNNTYYFYQRGFYGVLIEPNPLLHKKLVKMRPKDVSLNIGVGDKQETRTYYLFPEQHNALNTFSEEEKNEITKNGIPVVRSVELLMRDINSIIREHFSTPPSIISIDVEGLDEAILRTLDFERYAPQIICVETISFSDVQNNTFVKRNELIEYILSKNYEIFADTYFNTIFIKKSK